MAVNSTSSSSDDPLLHSNLSLINVSIPVNSCPIPKDFAPFSITHILLLLPLCILVLYLGLQRWQRQCSTSTAAMSHSDIFTYHMVAIELIGVIGSTLRCCGIYGDHYNVFIVGSNLWAFTWYGEMFFHNLTCVEHYLAVVHPVTYLSLRGERGIRIRNISIGCVWLLCVGVTSSVAYAYSPFCDFCLLIFSLIVVVFCSLSVLRVLIHPGPGEQGGDRERVDQTKRRAFYTIMAILGVLLLRSISSLVWTIRELGQSECIKMFAEIWLNLPSSLVLPLLFLHRTGKLAFCKNNTSRE